MPADFQHLASHQRAVARIQSAWPAFQAKRAARLKQDGRYGAAAEKVAEGVLEDLFTQVLDWPLQEINAQVGRSDMLLSRSFIKHLIVEVKRPGALVWSHRAVDAALEQARRYADDQKVKTIAVSDGTLLHAVDRMNGSERPRVRARLDAATAPNSLWWLAVDGIYREIDEFIDEAPFQQHAESDSRTETDESAPLLHPKYQVPARCFAYVGNANDPHTWKLPYCHADGSPDLSRLPKAIQAILSNYRGAHISTVPDEAIPGVLIRLGRIAVMLGRLPARGSECAPAYVALEEALKQIGKLDEVMQGSSAHG